jgi:hypothetical protein
VPLNKTTQAGMLKMLRMKKSIMYDFKLSKNKDDESPMFLLKSLIFLFLQQTNPKREPISINIDQLFKLSFSWPKSVSFGCVFNK